MEELSVRNELKKLDKLKIPDKAKEKMRKRLLYQINNQVCHQSKKGERSVKCIQWCKCLNCAIILLIKLLIKKIWHSLKTRVDNL